MSETNGSASKSTQPAKNQVGGFEVVAKIGRGAMGTVFKARQVSVDRIVALKILPPRLAKSTGFVQRFLLEARAAAKLNHPNIVQAIDAGEAAGYQYFAMEFVEGPSLQTLLETHGRLPERQALNIARDVAAALDHAHRAGIIHRDIKPANILLTLDGAAKLADLGLARVIERTDAGLTRSGDALGTPHYVSPEQARGETALDGRTDIYALGATLYHMICGFPPYTGGTGTEVMSKHLTAPVPDPRQLNPDVSAASRKLIRKAMAKAREQRQANAQEMLTDIERALAALDGPAPRAANETALRRARPVTAPAPAHGAGRIWLYAGSAAVLVAVLVVIGILMSGGSDPAPKGQALLDYAQKWAAENPGQYQRAIQKYKETDENITDPMLKMRIRDAIEDLERQRSGAADNAFRSLQEEADRLKTAGKYPEAAAVFSNLPAEFADLLTERAKAAATQTQAEAEARIKTVMIRAGRFADEGDPKRGLDELGKLDGVVYPPLASDLQSLREKLQEGVKQIAANAPSRAALAAANRAAETLLANIEAAAARKNFAEIATLADAAAKDETLDPLRARADAIVRVARIIAKAGPKKQGEWVPKTADEHVAAAILALAGNDPAQMGAELDAARGHELYARYAAKQATLKITAPQQRARERLDAFRKALPAALKARKCKELAAELEKMIQDSQLAYIHDAAQADLRPVSKLVAVMDRVRTVVAANIGKPAHYHGIATTIKSLDGETVTFSIGKPEAITEMRAVDIANLLALSPAPADSEAIALLFLADGDPDKAQPYVLKTADRTDIEHLGKLLAGEAREDTTPEAPKIDVTTTTGLSADDAQAIKSAYARSEDLYKSNCRIIDAQFEDAKEKIKSKWRLDWERANERVRDAERDLKDAKENRRTYSYYYYDSYYYTNRISSLERYLSDAKNSQATLGRTITNATAKAGNIRDTKKEQLTLVRDRNRRILLTGKKIPEEDVQAAYDAIMNKD